MNARSPVVVGALAGALTLGGCTGDSAEPGVSPTSSAAAEASAPANDSVDGEQRFPDVLDARLTAAADGTYDVEVTISSPYDTPDRYADGWRVLAPDGTVLGEHMLAHDHAGEQPFTRTQRGLSIPSDVESVTVEGRDQEFGYGGGTVEVPVP